MKWLLIFLCLNTVALATNWTFSHNNLNNTATDTESVNSVTINSNLSRPSSGFLQKTVTSSSGAHAPSNGSVIYGLEVPGLYYLQQPTLDNEGQIIYSVASGSCPSGNYNGIFVFGQWDPNGANDVTSASQVGFGAFAWNNSTNTATISNMYNLSALGTISTFSANVYFGSCSGGTYTASGSGDRGGTMYMSSEGGAFFKTNANHGIMIVPQKQIPNANALVGDYAVLRYDSVASQTIKSMRISVDTLGSSANGNALTDPSDVNSSDGTYADVFTISAINSPFNGMVTGTLSHNGGGSVNLACAVHLTSKNVMFCAGQSPDLSSKPLNMTLVSDTHAFNRANGFDYDVRALSWDNTNKKLYIGGSFSWVGTYTRPFIARLNSDGTMDTGFTYAGTGLDDVVHSLALDSANNKIWAGGNFLTYNGTDRQRIARLNTDGTLDTVFAPSNGANSNVYTLAWDTSINKIYLGGAFTSVNGSGRRYLARMTTAGVLDTTFTQTSTGLLSHVLGMERDPATGKLYVGGHFTTYGATTRKYVARILTSGGLDTAFAQTGTGLGNSVRAVAWDTANNKLYVGGEFTDYNSTTRNYVARLTSAGALDTDFAPTGSGLDSSVYSLYWDSANSKIYVGGNFASYNGTTRKRLARLNSDGTLDTSFVPDSNGFDQTVYAIAVDPNSGRVHAGGLFSNAAGYALSHYASLTSTGALDSQSVRWIGGNFDMTSALIYELAFDTGSNRLFVFGGFASFNGAVRSGIVKLLPSGLADAGFATQGTGFSVAPYGGCYDATRDKIYAAGDFNSYNGVTRTKFARLNSDGTLDTTYNMTGTSFNAYTDQAICDTANNKVYVKGAFLSYNGTSRTYIARLNSDGSLDTSFALDGTGITGPTAIMLAAALDRTSGKLYLGGSFDNYNGTTRNNLLRLNTDGTLDTGFTQTGTGLDSDVNALVWDASENKLYVGGAFQNYNGNPLKFLARMDSSGNLDTGFTLTGTGFDNAVTSISLDTVHHKVYVVGAFESYNGTTTHPIARLNSDGSLDTSFVITSSPQGYGGYQMTKSAWDSNNNRLFVAGTFSRINGILTGPIARLTTTGAVD